MTAQWKGIADRTAIEPGDVLSVDDYDIVVWSTADGRLCAMDARCPHQWSHLAAEGAVDGSELVCTSHFWRFGVDGAGSKMSMAGRRDPKSAAEVFPTRVIDGRVEVLLADDRRSGGP